MYTLNSQLAHFCYNLDAEKLIVNIKWFKYIRFTKTFSSLNKAELDLLIGFISNNKVNFPNLFFIEKEKKNGCKILDGDEISKTELPLYLILSQDSNINPDNEVYNAVPITLMDKSYSKVIHYNLNFDIVGRIEIYRKHSSKMTRR